MTPILCAKEDFKNPLFAPLPELSEEESRSMVRSVLSLLRPFGDERPCAVFGVVSVRTEKVLERNHVTSIADLARFVIQATSNQGMFGAGPHVIEECSRLIRTSVAGA